MSFTGQGTSIKAEVQGLGHFVSVNTIAKWRENVGLAAGLVNILLSQKGSIVTPQIMINDKFTSVEM